MKVVGFVGYSGSGKTTLIEQLVSVFVKKGLTVSTVKNAHHGFDMDRPGKDTYRFREAGATQVLIRTDRRWALLTETVEQSVSLSELLAQLAPCDLVIVEGFKSEKDEILRLEVWRKGIKDELPIFLQDPMVQAVVTDEKSVASCQLPILDINNPHQVAEWIIGKLAL